MKINSFGPLTEEKIRELESVLGVKLPQAYKEFLKDTGGGTVEQDGTNRVSIPAIGKAIAIDVFFGYGVARNSDLLHWNREYAEELLENAVLIGFDTRQGFLFLIASDSDNGLYYWDDSFNFDESDDEQNVYRLDVDLSLFESMQHQSRTS